MTNLYFIRMDAEYIENVFAENEVAMPTMWSIRNDHLA